MTKTDNRCRLLKEGIVPSEDLAYIFEHTKAGAELDPTFLCFEEVYYRIRDMITKDFTIVDLGCAYAFQAYLFKDFKRYIGIDITDAGRLTCSLLPNAEFYQADATKWLTDDDSPYKNLDLEKTIGICSYNPSYHNEEMCRIIKEHFPNHFLKYCEWEEYRINACKAA